MTKHGGGIAEAQGSRTLREERRRGARHRRSHVGPEREQASVSICETERAVRRLASHPKLEERQIINGRSGNFFVRPPVKDFHDRIFNGPPPTRRRAEVVSHSVWNFGDELVHSLKV